MSNRINKQPKRILPAALLIEGRKCLVVGGGAVAGRKAESLLDAGAEVVLVAPDIGEHAESLRHKPGMTLVRREYAPADLENGLFLVVTATDDSALNRRILDACHARGILCACPDHGWENGDLISPASFRHKDLTVSVSTGGASCRRSRLVKENLARHIAALDRAELLVAGTDHRFTGIGRRESLCPAGDRLNEAAEMLRQVMGIHEFMLLSTCNRIEFAGLAADSAPLLNIVKRTLGLDGLDGRFFYVHRGRDAFRHLVMVASGLLSQSVGESHILAQIKACLEQSRAAGWSAGVLQDWVGRALHIGKAVRHAARGLISATDVEDTCKAFLEHECGGIRDRRILVIGSGMIGKALTEKFISSGARVSCCYRSNPPKLSGADSGQPAVFPLSALEREIRNHEIVICAARCDAPLLTAKHGELLNSGAMVVDLGVPRNVAQDFKNTAPGVKLFDLDDIERFRNNNDTGLQQALDKGEEIISEHMEHYDRIMAGIRNGVRK